MKKLLAFLLVLLLPISVLADSMQMTLEVQADAQVFPAYAKAMLKSICQMDDADAAKYANALSALLQDLKIQIVEQEDAVAIDVEIAGSALLDLTFHETADAAYMTSTLLPGYAFVTAVGEGTASSEAENDWNILSAGVKEKIGQWFERAEPTIASGVFQGDAYAGGTQCKTWLLTDQDIAETVSDFMDSPMRTVLAKILIDNGEDTDTLLQRIEALNALVSKESKHYYIIRKVENDAGELIGASCTFMKDASQLATVSLGLDGDKRRLVLGLGLNQQNYWWEYRIQKKQREHLTLLKGESREWTAAKEDAFAYIKETYVSSATYVWSCNLTESGNRLLWDGSVYEGETTSSENKCFAFSGGMNRSAATLDAEFSLVLASRTPIRIRFSSSPGEAIGPIGANLVLCDPYDTEDKTLYDTLYTQLSFEMVSRLMQLLPLDVIMTLGEMVGL